MKERGIKFMEILFGIILGLVGSGLLMYVVDKVDDNILENEMNEFQDFKGIKSEDTI